MVNHPVYSKKKPPTLQMELDHVELPILLEDEEPEVVRTRAVFIPANVSRHWSEQEIGFVNTDPAVRVKNAYPQYVRDCKAAGLSARSYQAFGHKRRSLVSILYQ